MLRKPSVKKLKKRGDVEGLITILCAGSDRQQEATKALVELGDVAVDQLVDALHDDDCQAGGNQWAAFALGEIGGSRASAALVSHFENAASIHVAVALGSLGDPRAVEPLIEALGHESESVRGYAASSLGLLRDPRAIDPLMARINSEEDPKARDEALDALHRIDPDSAAKAGWTPSWARPSPDVAGGERAAAGAVPAGENPICSSCGTVYNRSEVVRQLREQSPELFDFATWQTKFECVKCGEEIQISGGGAIG